mmetsp:Transcript_78078/g.220787  ORF Transcript_78078/g.220787 Transcript_78078/m.220787 type:complete len:748 (-) Transcript_78078:95-2338(-)|eukprot:CAMPEP_0168364474 /NCGR_PEP_ID=MMETSP0228-20121227/4226_1 /TAXON_ID=133427 /ORGANISM="Protoceratium reticulatum, Strain CCCM 535 (=CCMP 1889)" /LENGTH=747 /DNA_ID=CAMNT_0008377235 /DNA_START=38 /DNA_END=2281 /DNA_ORIENTATION=-
MAADGAVLAVVPVAAPAAGQASVFNLAKAAAKANDDAHRELSSGESLAQRAEDPIPLEWTWLLFRTARTESFCKGLVKYALFTALFTAIFQMIRPVNTAFSVQDALLRQTTHADILGGSAGVSFYDISSDAAWFQWVEAQLLPTILSEEYFNGDLRNNSWSRRFANTVAMYNTQTAPVRFRQARVVEGSCDTPAGNSAMARPCWGDFSADRQVREAFGEEYGNRYVTGLGSISAGGLQSYGCEAHVVDVPLDKSTALEVVSRMKQGLWLNEQTRVVAIETNWYNANLDLSTYCRWQIDISPGGRFTPSVVLYSCRLNPYASTLDNFRMALELLFVALLIYFFAECFHDIHSAKSAYFRSLWNWLELINLILYLWIVVWWIAYLLKDKSPFEVVSSGTYSDRPDLARVASHFSFMANMAAFNIVFSYLKLFNYLQVVPSLGLLWRTLRLAAIDTWPFLCVFLLFTCGFAFAGHWMFGLMMIEFHSWPRSFVTLFLTMVGGFPYDEIKRVAPASGVLFTISWVSIMVMVVANMFVAILVEWYHRVEEEHRTEELKLGRATGGAHVGRPLWGLLYWPLLASLWQRLTGRQGPVTGPEQHLLEARRLLRLADLREADTLREALVSGDGLVAADLARHFRGDLRTAHGFLQAVEQFADSQSVGASGADFGDPQAVERTEAQEQEQLRNLQGTVERLEGHMRQLRSALSVSSVAPLRAGQDQRGYSVRLHGEEPAGPAPAVQALALPGAVPER